MAVADRFRAAANYGRRAAAAVGQRPTTVAITVETWSGAYGTDGAALVGTPATTTLAPNPDVNVVAYAPSVFGGGYATGGAPPLVATTVRVGPVTPDFPGGGYPETTLNPTPTGAAQRVYLTLRGGQFDDAGERFDLDHVEAPTPQSTYLIAVRSQQT